MPLVELTLKSVLGQDYGDLEYIVIDGCSNDGTVDIIKSHQHRLAAWISEKDSGIADAFNKGLFLSSGQYVLFLNADDALVHSGVITSIAQQIVANDYPAFVYGDCNVLERGSGEIMYRAAVGFTRAGLFCGRMPPHPSLFSKRAYFERHGGFDTKFKMAMDFEWFLRGARQERVVHVPILVTNVRTGGVSTQQPQAAVQEILLALRKNGYLSSRLTALAVEAYFYARSATKKVLQRTGARSLVKRISGR